ncbi:18017_t:CDS:2, partial [Gigaspora rosea]
QDQFREELLRQLAYELWEEISWARQGDSSSFTWNQTWWNSVINSICSHMDIDPAEWVQPFDEHTD